MSLSRPVEISILSLGTSNTAWNDLPHLNFGHFSTPPSTPKGAHLVLNGIHGCRSDIYGGSHFFGPNVWLRSFSKPNFTFFTFFRLLSFTKITYSKWFFPNNSKGWDILLLFFLCWLRMLGFPKVDPATNPSNPHGVTRRGGGVHWSLAETNSKSP